MNYFAPESTDFELAIEKNSNSCTFRWILCSRDMSCCMNKIGIAEQENQCKLNNEVTDHRHHCSKFSPTALTEPK